MEKARLVRGPFTECGTFGAVHAPGLRLYSLELNWYGNTPNESCTPPGEYFTRWSWSRAFGRFMYMLCDVPGRSGVRLHSANLAGDPRVSACRRKQLNGCIAFGERVGRIDGQPALLISAPAMRRFEDAMGRRDFILEIVNHA